MELTMVETLETYNVHTVKDVLSRTLWDLQEILDLPLDRVQEVVLSVARVISPSPTTVCFYLTLYDCMLSFLCPLERL